MINNIEQFLENLIDFLNQQQNHIDYYFLFKLTTKPNSHFFESLIKILKEKNHISLLWSYFLQNYSHFFYNSVNTEFVSKDEKKCLTEKFHQQHQIKIIFDETNFKHLLLSNLKLKQFIENNNLLSVFNSIEFFNFEQLSTKDKTKYLLLINNKEVLAISKLAETNKGNLINYISVNPKYIGYGFGKQIKKLIYSSPNIKMKNYDYRLHVNDYTEKGLKYLSSKIKFEKFEEKHYQLFNQDYSKENCSYIGLVEFDNILVGCFLIKEQNHEFFITKSYFIDYFKQLTIKDVYQYYFIFAMNKNKIILNFIE